MRDMAILRLSLEGMRHDILQAFSAEMLGMEKRIEEEVIRVTSNFNLDAEVQKHVRKVYEEEFARAVRMEVERQVRGYYLPIEKAVRLAINKILKEKGEL